MLSDSEIRDDLITLMQQVMKPPRWRRHGRSTYAGPAPPYRGLRAEAHRTPRLRPFVIAIR